MNEDEYLAQIVALCDVDNWEGALQRVQSALDAYPHSAQFWRIQGQLILRPDSGWESAEALESFQHAVQFDPADAQAQFELGRYLLRVNNDPQPAIAALEKASQLEGGETVEEELAAARKLLAEGEGDRGD